MSPGREPERGWLITIGSVTESQMDTAWYRLFFWGLPSEASGEEKIDGSSLKSLDPDA
jgi:hypothetical protein